MIPRLGPHSNPKAAFQLSFQPSGSRESCDGGSSLSGRARSGAAAAMRSPCTSGSSGPALSPTQAPVPLQKVAYEPYAKRDRTADAASDHGNGVDPAGACLFCSCRSRSRCRTPFDGPNPGAATAILHLQFVFGPLMCEVKSLARAGTWLSTLCVSPPCAIWPSCTFRLVADPSPASRRSGRMAYPDG